jgi:serralysin
MAYIVGTNKADELNGTSHNDVINARGGDDLIIGSNGVDRINGGSGQDTVDYSNFTGSLSITLAETGETEVITDSPYHDTLVSIENITGGFGDDYFAGNSADNTFRGGAGDDYFVASNGYDTYYGNSGYDMVDYSKTGTGLTIRPTGFGYSTVIAGGTAYDALYSIENIIGTRFNDEISGDKANNYFLGMRGDDQLSGGAGGDVLNGGANNDTLTGGRDADIFEFKGSFGDDTVTDFDAHGDDHDFIDLSALNYFDNFADLKGNTTQDGDDVIIDAGSHGTITLENVDIDHLTADQFIL